VSIILGFGCIEVQVRAEITAAAREAVANGRTVESVLAKWNELARVYDKQPRGVAPERYTSASYFGGKLHFTHINREHPFSPDGWAGLFVEEEFDTREPAAMTATH
jgi:hypothetical protein